MSDKWKINNNHSHSRYGASLRAVGAGGVDGLTRAVRPRSTRVNR